MIIKGERVATTRAASSLLRHLLRGEDNDRITIVQGTEEDVRAAFADARDSGQKFALRHFIISPESETTDNDALMILGHLGREFGFDVASAIGIKHVKQRAVTEVFGAHWHFLVPELDAATGRILDSRYNYLRHSKTAAVAAYRLGHPFVRSPHEKAILGALEADGHLDVRAALQEFIEQDPGGPHREAFSRDVHQMGKRQGLDVPRARAAVRAAWETTVGRTDFESALVGRQLRVRPGDKPETFIVETLDGVFVGAAHRLARVRRLDFRNRMEGALDVRECSAATHQRATVSRTSSFGDPEHQGPPGSIRSARRLGGGGDGSNPNIARGNSDSDPGPADRQRSVTPAHRRDSPLRARCSARRFRKILSHNSGRILRLTHVAAFLAQPPADRVAHRLSRYEEKLEGHLRILLSPPPPSAALAAAKRDAAHLRERIGKYEQAIAIAQRELRSLTDGGPRGVVSRIDGSRGRWQQTLAVAGTRCAALKEKHSALREQSLRKQDFIRNLEHTSSRQHYHTLRSAECTAQAEQLRQQIARIQTCRSRLAIFPALAWGGLNMVLATVAATPEAERLIESDSGPPSSSPLATYIWGVGLL